MKIKNIVKLVVAVLLLVALAFQFRSQTVSLTFHELFGLAVTALIIVHLAMSASRWMTELPLVFRRGMAAITRLTYIVTMLLVVCVIMLIGTGLYLRGVVGANGQVTSAWVGVHQVFAALTVIAVGAHIGLNWDAVMNSAPFAAKMPQMARRVFAVLLLAVIAGFGSYAAATTEFSALLGGSSGTSNPGNATFPGRGTYTPGSFPTGFQRPSGFPTTGGNYTPRGNYTPGGNYTGQTRPSGAPTPSGTYTPGAGRGNRTPGGQRPSTQSVAQNRNPLTGTLEYLAIVGMFAIVVGGIVWLVRRANSAPTAAVQAAWQPGDSTDEESSGAAAKSAQFPGTTPMSGVGVAGAGAFEPAASDATDQAPGDFASNIVKPVVNEDAYKPPTNE